MIGNLSKVKGVLGETGPMGPTGPQGEQGEKGDTPTLVLRYDQETGNLYYSSDGVLADKEYISSKNLVTKDELADLIPQAGTSDFVINLNTSFAGDKTYDEIVEAYKEGREIVGVMPDMNMTFRFTVSAYNDSGVQLMTQVKTTALTLICTTDNAWIPEKEQVVTDTQLKNKLNSITAGIDTQIGDIETALDNIITKYGLGGETE